MIRLVNTTAPHVPNMRPLVLDLFRSNSASQLESQVMRHTIHRPIPAPEPNPEPNPGPDAVRHNSHAKNVSIPVLDWDELFRAILVRLEYCVGDSQLRTPQLALYDRHTVTKETVLECVTAMKQLHAFVMLERQECQEQLEQQKKYQQHQLHQLSQSHEH